MRPGPQPYTRMETGRPMAPQSKVKGGPDHLVEAALPAKTLPRKPLLLEQILQSPVDGTDIHAILITRDLRGGAVRQVSRLLALGLNGLLALGRIPTASWPRSCEPRR